MTKKIHIDLENYYKNNNESSLHIVLLENDEKSNTFLIKRCVIERLLREIELSGNEVCEHLKTNNKIETKIETNIKTNIEKSFDYAWF